MKFIAKRQLRAVFFAILALSGIFLHSACADSVLIKGAIFNRAGTPLPGCTVFAISGSYKTPPVISETSGTFEIELSLQTGSPSSYFLEIYWGQELMYRKPLFRQPTNDPLWQTQNGVLEIPPITLGL